MAKHATDLLRRGRVLVSVSPDLSVHEAAQMMTRHNVGAVLVLDRTDRLVGIFTERDLLQRVVAPGLDPRETPIEQVMTREVLVADASSDLDQVMQIMNQRKCRHLPVADGERLLGVISMRDLHRHELAEKDFAIRQMESYIFNGW